MHHHKVSFGKIAIWSMGGLGLLSIVLYQVFYQNQGVMQKWLHYIALSWGRSISFLCGAVPFSAAELCWTGAIVAAIIWVVRFCILLYKRPTHWKKESCFRLLSFLCVGLFIWGGYTGLWGIGYRSGAFYTEEIGLSSHPISVEQLTQVTKLFAEKAGEYALQVPRQKDGSLAISAKELFSQTDHLYDNIQQEFPTLQGPVRRAKPMFYGPIMSHMGFTGFYFPFTGEANVNIHSPLSLIPATIAHELAHQRGVVFEDEANFTAIAACLSQSDPVFLYSGYLMGYIHLSNALLKADSSAWGNISDSLHPFVRKDLEDNNAFWEKYQSPITTAAEGIYEGFLQSHGENRGLQSYGACVNLLVAYYGKDINA